MSSYYIVFDASGNLVTRLPINAEVTSPRPKNIALVDADLWFRTISENDGQWVRRDDGTILKVPFQVAAKTRYEVEAMRLRSYADPLTGSDRMFSEALRMQTMGESGYEEVRARAIARFEEIQAQYPWPAK